MLDKKSTLLKHYGAKLIPGPLNGVIVVGYSYYVAGPIAMQQLVNLGALVIKIEGKPLGDPTRQFLSEEMFNALNYGQLSVAIDYKNPQDCQFMAQLLNQANIIMDNRSPSARQRDSTLKNHFKQSGKRQIYCTISGFPQPDKYPFPAVDASVQAATGFPYTNCHGEDTPLKVGAPILDYTSGLFAASYILAYRPFLDKTLYPNIKYNTMHIRASLAGASIWFQTGQIINALKGMEFFRSGNEDRFAAPFSYYTTKDGMISIATVSNKQFKRLCLDILKDEKFREEYPTIKIRTSNKQMEFEKAFNDITKTQKTEYWIKKCAECHISSSPVLKVKQAITKGYVQPLLKQTTDGKSIISSGVNVLIADKPLSFFNTKSNQSTKPFPAHKLNEDRSTIEHLLRSEKPSPVLLSSKL
ncbi:MAG: CoA transferase [Gammaproteobacteria bacterium]|nr:CoA transferase [Gammaproteobacteria bacterium]